MLLLDGDISLDLTPYLKIDDTVYNASILMTFSRVWEDVFAASHDGGRLTHTEWGWNDRLWSLPLCLSLLLFPPVDFCICRPTSTLEKQNEDPWNEMPNAALLVTRIGGGVKLWQRKDQKRKNERKGEAKLLAITTSVRVQFTADGLINLPSSQCGQAFTVGRRQMLLVAPKLHPRDTLPFGKWIWNCCNKYKK